VLQDAVVGSRLGVSLGIAQVEVFASAAARAAVLEAERIAQVAAEDDTTTLTYRPTRLADLLVTPATDRAEVHAVLRDVAEAQAQLHALQAAALSRFAELQPHQPALPGSRTADPADADRPDDWVADEVAVVLGIGTGTASVLVDKQRALVEQLPTVWAALADGRVDVRRAQVLVDALAHRKRSAGGGLDDEVVDAVAAQGLRWISEGIGPTPLTDRVGAALIAADPAEAERRAGRRKRKQNVLMTGCGDGLAGLRADLLDAADAAAMMAVLDAMAAVMRKAGDRRPVGQLRIEALKQLLTRPWDSVPDEVARACWQLRLRVDLADLDDLGPVLADLDGDDAAPRDLRDGGHPAAASTPDHDGTAPEHRADPDSRISSAGAAVPAAAADGTPGAGSATGSAAAAAPAAAADGRPGAEGGTGSAGAPGAGDGVVGRPGGGRGTGSAGVPGAGDGVGRRGGVRGSGSGSIGRVPVTPAAVAEILARSEALLGTEPAGRRAGGDVWFEVVDRRGRLQALASVAELRAAVRRGGGLGPPPPVDRYTPSAEQTRFVRARDRHCRFPGCARPAEYVDLDHVEPHDHGDPAQGGRTCVTNLACLCRRHHRLKTHAPGWVFAMDPDGTLHVTPPGGTTRTTRPAGIAEVDMSTPTCPDVLTDLLGRTPSRFRSPTPEQRAARRQAAADRARIAAEIEAELDAALARAAAGTPEEDAAAGTPREADPPDEVDRPPF